MSIEENKAILQRFFDEMWDESNETVVDELIAEDCPHHMNGIINFRGPEGYKVARMSWIRAFPGLETKVDEMIGEGDLIAARCRIIGTHQGDLQFGDMTPIPATGTKIDVAVVGIARVSGGKICEQWDVADYGWIAQLVQG